MTDEYYYKRSKNAHAKILNLSYYLNKIDEKDDSYNSMKEKIFDIASSIYDLMAEIMGEYS